MAQKTETWKVSLAVAVLGLACVAIAPATLAQTDAGGMFRPWDKSQSIEQQADAIFLNQGRELQTDQAMKLTVVESLGRYRFTDAYKLNPTIGYDYFYVGTQSRSHRVPTSLNDISVGFGSPVWKNGDWFAAAHVAVGYAGDSMFSEGDGFYGKATALVGKELGPESNIVFALAYDGSRPTFPDIPIPAVEYTFRLDAKFRFVVGFPFNTVVWEPRTDVRAEATYSYPDNLDARLNYDLIKQLRVFLNLEHRERAFHVGNLPSDQRLIFWQKRLETGLRWQPHPRVGVVVAGGYAFDQKFDYGFDSRRTHRLSTPNDQPYVRFAVEIRP